MMYKPLEQIAVTVFLKLTNDPKFRQQAYDSGLKIFHFIQVKTGNVNLHSPEKAVKIAVSTCIRKDKDSQAKVAAFVTGLYLQHKVERAAQVGGSLLRHFGKSWFPHIQDRELRFALDVDPELEKYLYSQFISNID